MPKRVLAVVGAAAGAVLLSGCVALELPLAAVTADTDGVPRVLIRPCADDPYEDPTLSGWAGAYEDEPSEDDADTTVWETAGEWSGAEEFPLFSPCGLVGGRGRGRAAAPVGPHLQVRLLRPDR